MESCLYLFNSFEFLFHLQKCSLPFYVIWFPRSSLIADLWSQVELEDTERLNLELGNKWLLLMEAKASKNGESACLVEQVQVSEGELLGNWLLNLDDCLILLAITLVGGELDESVTS